MFKWLRKNEQGSVMVIVAIALTVLLGFTGMAVDFGGMAMTKQELQNAADAAALAAGQVRVEGQTTGAADVAGYNIIEANGFVPGDGKTVANIQHEGDKVIVTIETPQDLPFTATLTGKKETTIQARAVAQITSAVGNFPYALFAAQEMDDGGDGLDVNGQGSNGVTIYGNMHSNSDIRMKHANVIGGVATAVGDISIQSGSSASTLVIPMPDCSGLIADIKNNAYTVSSYSGSLEDLIEKALDNGQPKNGVINIYVKSSLSFKKGKDVHNSDYPVNLLVQDDLNFSKATVTSEDDAPFVFISETGDITVNGVSANAKHFHGLILAPEGDVTFNGNTVNIEGSVIAQNIRKNGGSFTVTYNEYVDFHLPDGKVRLIE